MEKLNNFINMLLVAAITLFLCFFYEAESLKFNHTSFTSSNIENQFIRNGSEFQQNSIQVTTEARGIPIENKSGRIWYYKPLKLWSKKNKNVGASFNTTFILNISPNGSPTATEPRWGHGLAFILSGEKGLLPENSNGTWLGLVNQNTNGSANNNIVAVEFDTNKSYKEDLDDNHVGVDVNSVNSIEQKSLTPHGVNLSSGNDVNANLRYDGKSKELEIYVFMNGSTVDMKPAVISMKLNLSDHLPRQVYVGFSASTGGYAELNCIKSWSFDSTEVDDDEVLWFMWIGIAIGLLVAGIIVVLFYKWWNFLRKTKVSDIENSRVEQQIQRSASAPQKFQLKDLKRATGNFDPKNMLGSGGFGVVYRGLLSNKEVAVKRLSNNSRHGKQEFLAEVTIIGKIHHKNLVKLVGWCHDGNELLVVYEFMPNGSLDKLIFRRVDSRLPRLSWEMRHVIISGVAQALDYLHNCCENRVLHRDIKASNIMLDSEFNPRLGDFGLARTITGNGKTHHSTQEIAGTPGYMAPESFLIGKATVETDVYAFGVLILEIACGKKPGSQTEENNYNNRIVELVWSLHKRDCLMDATDVEADVPFEQEQQVECVLKLGLACCHPNPYERPSMRTVLQVLKGEASPPHIPKETPVFMWPAMPASYNGIFDESLAGGQVSPITILTSGR